MTPVPAQQRPEPGDARFAAAVIALAASCLLARAVFEPFDHGYLRYAGLADEMLRSGDLVVPRLGDWIYLHKPPLFVWLVAATGALVGLDGALPQHVPNLLALALSSFWIVRLGTRLFGRRDLALLAALVHATTFEVFSLTRDRRIDPLFAALLLGAFDAFHAALTEPARRTARMALCGALVGAATLVKGPLAIGFFLAVAIAVLAAERRLRLLAGAPGLAAIGALLAVVLPWPIALASRLGATEAWRLLSETPLTTRRGGLLHYVWNLPGQLAPWTILVPALALDLAQRGRALAASRALRFVGLWALVLLVLLHTSSAKHSRYLLPAFAPLALALVSLFDAPGAAAAPPRSERVERWRDLALRLALWSFALAGPLAIAAALARVLRLPAAVPAVLVSGALGLAGARRGLAALARREPVRAALALGLLALVAFAAMDAVRTADLLRRSRLPETRAVLERVPRDAPLFALGAGERARIVVGVVSGRPARPLQPSDALLPSLRSPTGAAAAGVWLLTRPDRVSAVAATPGVTIRERHALPVDRDELALLALELDFPR